MTTLRLNPERPEVAWRSIFRGCKRGGLTAELAQLAVAPKNLAAAAPLSILLLFLPPWATMTHTDAQHSEEHAEHDIWVHMTPEVRRELRTEDSDAWKAVVGVLIFIIAIGLVLAVFTASLSWLW
jgi:hypothetical protein